jgi:hypothetical protein
VWFRQLGNGGTLLGSEIPMRLTHDNDAPGARTLRRVIAATIAIVSIALVSTAASEGTAVAIIHPMQPIGNIDCCH